MDERLRKFAEQTGIAVGVGEETMRARLEAFAKLIAKDAATITSEQADTECTCNQFGICPGHRAAAFIRARYGVE